VRIRTAGEGSGRQAKEPPSPGHIEYRIGQPAFPGGNVSDYTSASKSLLKIVDNFKSFLETTSLFFVGRLVPTGRSILKLLL
jgi:hypothetical protein